MPKKTSRKTKTKRKAKKKTTKKTKKTKATKALAIRKPVPPVKVSRRDFGGAKKKRMGVVRTWMGRQFINNGVYGIGSLVGWFVQDQMFDDGNSQRYRTSEGSLILKDCGNAVSFDLSTQSNRIQSSIDKVQNIIDETTRCRDVLVSIQEEQKAKGFTDELGRGDGDEDTL